MKRFDVKNNIAIVTTEGFKNSIRSAVEFTYRERNAYGQTMYDRLFIGTIVTFNPNNQEVEYFSVREFCDSSDTARVDELLLERVARISANEEYSANELITIIKASDFEYNGLVGYRNDKEQEVINLKIENKFMAIYIKIISLMNEELIEDLNLSLRTRNCLKRAGYETVQQVKGLSFNEIARVRNLGRSSLEELERVLDITFV